MFQCAQLSADFDQIYLSIDPPKLFSAFGFKRDSMCFFPVFNPPTILNDVFELVEVSAEDEGVIDEIGRLRYEVWGEALDRDMFPDNKWVDAMDHGADARHWVIKIEDEDSKAGFGGGKMVASGRLTRHHNLVSE